MRSGCSGSVCPCNGQSVPSAVLQVQGERRDTRQEVMYADDTQDCDKVVAQKFFPIEEGDGMHPLCERDYFARLGLICAKCDQALRSSYITACGEFHVGAGRDEAILISPQGNKYHVEHFTCSECDVLFGPNDSYYEHAGKVCE